MIQIKDNAYQMARKFEVRERNIAKLKNFFERKQAPYLSQAIKIVWKTVYSVYSPEVYVRTGNLIGATDTKTVHEGDTHGLDIFLNPEKANIDAVTKKWRGKAYYPSFVASGIWFKNVDLPARPFVKEWLDQIGERFEKDLNREVGKAVRV